MAMQRTRSIDTAVCGRTGRRTHTQWELHSRQSHIITQNFPQSFVSSLFPYLFSNPARNLSSTAQHNATRTCRHTRTQTASPQVTPGARLRHFSPSNPASSELSRHAHLRSGFSLPPSRINPGIFEGPSGQQLNVLCPAEKFGHGQQ